MESAFNGARGRPGALLFTHEQGAAWDVITLDSFRNWRPYAESETIAPEVSDAAAKKAGFANTDAIAPYRRSLIALHHDTLGTPVRSPYNPHSLTRGRHAVQFNEVYPHGPATGHVRASWPCGSNLLR